MLRLLQSNRLEVLARELGRALAPAPLQPQTIVVPHAGVGRWLWMALAEQRGISANLDCILPGSFVWRVFHRVLDDVPETSPYEPDVMLWRLHALLRDAGGDARLEGLGLWRDIEDDHRRLQLARALAQQFDQYLVYRPDLLATWQKRDTGGWQGELWRRLRAATAAPDWTTLRGRLERAEASRVREALPGPVAVFGLPLLSPGYLDVLSWLGGHIDVTMYLPNPCREYWGDIVAERDLARRAGVEDERALYLETGNALLASWGGQAREVIDIVHEKPETEIVDRFEPAAGGHMLATIQNHLLQLTEPARNDAALPVVGRGDRSVQVHVCHSARREVEVLHDQLQALFDADPTLDASDVVVMVPGIERHAAYIDAVFGRGDIAYRIADRDLRSGLACVDAFLALLDLPRERFEANDALAVLEAPPVRRRFGLAATDLPRVREWLRSTGVRRDLTAAPDDRGSWRAGLDRMLLGFALPGERDGLFAGVLPFDEIDGTDAVPLGALAEFVARLGRLASGVAATRTPARWAAWLARMLDDFLLAGSGDEGELQILRNAFAKLAGDAGRAGFDAAVGFDIVRDWLDGALEAVGSSGGYLGHGVTFANLIAMRNVPARVVCLVGLDDGHFPRQRLRRSFDLIASEPRRGDRSRRDDDRLAFLESLLNARDVFYVSYTGRDVRDDRESPPAVVVSELLDYCKRNFSATDAEDARSHVVTMHPLHPFSRRYFDGSDDRLFAYSAIHCEAAARAGRDTPPPFVTGRLEIDTDDAADDNEIDIEALVSFYTKPAKFVLRERLQIVYGEDAEPLDTRDPYRPGGLAQWQMHDFLADLMDGGLDADAAFGLADQSRFRAPGPLGEVQLRRDVATMEHFVAGLHAHLPGDPHWQDVAVTVPGATVTGRLGPLDAGGMYLWRQGKTRATHRIGTWLRHLLLCCAAPDAIAPVTHWYSSDKTFVYGPVANAQAHLGDLVVLYREAMQTLQPYAPRAAWAYVEAWQASGDDDKARAAARAAYGPGRGFTESEDPYTRRLFGLSPDFARLGELAVRILGPLHAHLRETDA